MRGSFAAGPLFVALFLATPASSQDAPPAPATVPIAQSVPDPADTPWPGGTITLDIDATDVQRGIYRVTQGFPLAPGTRRLTLLYPEWLPGHHAPRGPLAELVDIRFRAGNTPLSWRRDPVEVYAFHIAVPDGVREVTASFIHTSPLRPTEGRITMTQEMLNLQWEKMSLYPAGHYVRRIRVKPQVTFPQGWTAAAALNGASISGNRMSWAETDYEDLVDSPIFAGRHFRKWDLGSNVTLSAVADEPEQLAAPDFGIARARALVDESLALFGRPPFDRYEFLIALTSRMGGIGLEHLRSTEIQFEPDNFKDWNSYDWDRNTLAHELVHSWNGKFRRPAELWTPDYRQPMQGNLLWLYEGQTQFWGHVLSARSGVQSKDIVLGMFASQAGKYSEQPGRKWRSVEDTTQDPIFSARKPKPFASLARDEDYYNEGALVWLEADQIIRAGTGGARGLDDFARAFFSHPGGGQRTITYQFADVVSALNAVHRHDWAEFLHSRFEEPDRAAPLAGLERGGYRLVWRAEPNSYDKGRMENDGRLDLTHSIGIVIDSEGEVMATQWDGPAFNAGLVNGAKVVAVNGNSYDQERLKRAITDAVQTKRPIELLVKRGDRYLTVPVNWTGGLRWPWLERIRPGSAVPLDRLLEPRRGRVR